MIIKNILIWKVVVTFIIEKSIRTMNYKQSMGKDRQIIKYMKEKNNEYDKKYIP
jgi:hypothetical protein